MGNVKFNAQTIADILIGSCLSLDGVLEEQGFAFEELTAEELQELDELVLLCDGCNWWFGAEEITFDGCENVCDKCL